VQLPIALFSAIYLPILVMLTSGVFVFLSQDYGCWILSQKMFCKPGDNMDSAFSKLKAKGIRITTKWTDFDRISSQVPV
jgi:hypothetical protein